MNSKENDNEKIYKDLLKSYEVPAEKSKDQIWQAINDQIDTTEVNKGVETRVVPMWRWTSIAVAASLVLMVGFYLTNVSVIAPNGKSVLALLPDGSEAKLNAGSELSYNSLLWRMNRNLKQKGEIFYQVKKGEKFQVITDLGTVSVLGTSFNVRARDDVFEVACATGKVGVLSSRSGTSIDLVPGEMTRAIGQESLEKEAVSLDEIGNWRSGQLQFDEIPLDYVFGEIERTFNVIIDREALDMNLRYFSGSFNNSNLDQALAIVCGTANLSFKVEADGKVVIQ